MTYVPITPFGRTVTAGHIQHQVQIAVDETRQGVNKWEVLRALSTARKRIGVSDRTLSVLQALLSFHPETILGGPDSKLTVFPSNIAICDRLNGMPCSTMRRHLASLVKTGLIIRRDSPNGKRFVKRYGGQQQAFGFDLTPLVTRFTAFCTLADEVTAEEEAYQRLRRTVSLMRRDLTGLIGYGQETHPEAALWADLADVAATVADCMRRNTTLDVLKGFEQNLLSALNAARDLIDGISPVDVITNDAQNEHHHLNSEKDIYDLEHNLETTKAKPEIESCQVENNVMEMEQEANLPNIPINMILSACDAFTAYVPDKVRHWHQLVRAAEVVRPMMGISQSAWDDAVSTMGAEEAAVVVIAMLERFETLKSPGGYLRHLTGKARQGAFSCGPMIMALIKREAA